MFFSSRSFSGHSRFAAVVFAAVVLSLFPVVPAQATRGYEARVNKSAVTVDVAPGGWSAVFLTYTNTGTKTWKRDAAEEYVSLYLVGKRSTPVSGSSWRTAESPALIWDAEVAPGESTVVKFYVYGATPGTYTETFRLASEDTAWMYGSETEVTVRVSGAPVSAGAPPAQTPPAATSEASQVSAQDSASAVGSSGVRAMLLLRSARALSLAGNARVQVTLGFKNTGTGMWGSRALLLAGVSSAANDASASVRDSTWNTPAEPVREDTVTNPGEIGFLTFWVKAPPKRGTYRASFQLEVDGQAVEGGLIDIPLTVTSDGVIVSEPPIVAPDQSLVDPSLISQHTTYRSEEPIIRVGLFATVDDQMILSAPAAFRVQHDDGAVVCEFNANEEVTVRYDRVNGVYRALGPRCTAQSTEYLQVQRIDDPFGPLTMTDFYRPVSWLPGANDNTFRSILELRHSKATDEVWAINELPIEMYLRGLAETSDVSPLEYQKALLTAARTYAMYHWIRGTKHADEHFHVDAKYDQVYRGYGAEARSPRIVQGVSDTRGQIVTYNGDLAITPYFSRSDGRTRSWGEVWYGSYAWLVSVPVPHDEGQTLWGHGVGLSARGALYMASKDNATYRQILEHFYTGTSVMYFY